MASRSLRQAAASSQSGFTLIELVIVIVTLGIIAAVAVPRFNNLAESSKVTATRKEMHALKRAIVGNPEVVAGGQLIDRGFEGDVGFVPSSLADLVAKPDTISDYDRLTRLGWNGPYIDSSNGEYSKDAWGVPYVYDSGARTLKSVGGSDTIAVNF